MIKPISIQKIEGSTIFITFSNGELRQLSINKNDMDVKLRKRFNRILEPNTFKSVKIGHLGQLYWENCAEMIDEDGNIIFCEFDMSPEYVYHNSTKL